MARRQSSIQAFGLTFHHEPSRDQAKSGIAIYTYYFHGGFKIEITKNFTSGSTKNFYFCYCFRGPYKGEKNHEYMYSWLTGKEFIHDLKATLRRHQIHLEELEL